MALTPPLMTKAHSDKAKYIVANPPSFANLSGLSVVSVMMYRPFFVGERKREGILDCCHVEGSKPVFVPYQVAEALKGEEKSEAGRW